MPFIQVFTGSMNEMLTKIRSEAPPRLRARRPDVALELEQVIMRCLSKHPSDRFKNAGELQHALNELRQFGLVRSERGHARREVATQMSSARRSEAPRAMRETAATDVEPTTTPMKKADKRPGTGGRLLVATLLMVAICAVVALVLAMQGRFSRLR